MNAYFDAGVLVKIYCEEPNTAEALALILAEDIPLPLTLLQEAEIRNTFRLKLFRGEIDRVQVQQSLALLHSDIEVGRFEIHRPSESDVYRRAEHLSRLHTAQVGARLPDILHVAAALVLGCPRFVSLDRRQRGVAKKSGLTVLPRA